MAFGILEDYHMEVVPGTVGASDSVIDFLLMIEYRRFCETSPTTFQTS